MRSYDGYCSEGPLEQRPSDEDMHKIKLTVAILTGMARLLDTMHQQYDEGEVIE